MKLTKKTLKIRKIFLVFLALTMLLGLGAYASNQKYVILEPHETKYVDPYEITNETDRKIFAPYTDGTNKVLGNIKPKLNINTGERSFGFMGAKAEKFKNYFQNKVSFDSMQKLNETFKIGGFSVKDASYSWHTGSWGSCNRSCGGGTKYRSVVCKRANGDVMPDKYCSGTKPSDSESCNTQACYVTTCNSSNVGKKNASGKTCRATNPVNRYYYSWCTETRYKNDYSNCTKFSYIYYKKDFYNIRGKKVPVSCFYTYTMGFGESKYFHDLGGNNCRYDRCIAWKQVPYEYKYKCNYRYAYTTYSYRFQ